MSTSEAHKKAAREWSKRNRKAISAKVKEKYNTDPEFRDKIRKYHKERYHMLSEERKEALKAKARQRYRDNAEVREKQKQNALKRYYDKKKGTEDV